MEERKTMKKLLMAVLAGLMLVGCGQKKTEEPAPAATEAAATPEATAEATEAPAETSEKPGTLLGGWTVNEDYHTTYSEEDVARFEKATEGLVGVGYTPVEVVATQVVNGTNYAYIAAGKTVTAEPQMGYYVVVVNESSAGEISVVAINQIDIADVKTVDEAAAGELVGAWTVTDTGKPGMLPGEEAQASFDKATSDAELLFNPVVLLGTQVVNGTNYAAVCRGKNADGAVNLYAVKWNASADGSAEMLECKVFDLLSYVTAS